jgi:hypothetical protein
MTRWYWIGDLLDEFLHAPFWAWEENLDEETSCDAAPDAEKK